MRKFVNFFLCASAASTAAHHARADGRILVGGDDVCSIDIVQVQDMTSSFDSLWNTMTQQMKIIFQELLEPKADAIRYGLVTFGDKPLKNPDPREAAEGKLTGYDSDYCARVDIPLAPPSYETFKQSMDRLTDNATGGGGDWIESSLEGIQRALISKTVGWSHRATFRLIIVITDALTHLMGDVKRVTTLSLPANELQAGDLDRDINALCGKTEYPTLKRVAELLRETNTSLIVLAAPAGLHIDGKWHGYKQMKDQGDKYVKTPDGLALWYHDIFAAEGVDVYTSMVTSDLSDLRDVIGAEINKFKVSHCEGTTTTVAPTTTTEQEQNPAEASTVIPASSGFLAPTTAPKAETSTTGKAATTTVAPSVASSTTPVTSTGDATSVPPTEPVTNVPETTAPNPPDTTTVVDVPTDVSSTLCTSTLTPEKHTTTACTPVPDIPTATTKSEGQCGGGSTKPEEGEASTTNAEGGDETATGEETATGNKTCHEDEEEEGKEGEQEEEKDEEQDEKEEGKEGEQEEEKDEEKEDEEDEDKEKDEEEEGDEHHEWNEEQDSDEDGCNEECNCSDGLPVKCCCGSGKRQKLKIEIKLE